MRYPGIEGIKNNDAYAIENAIQFLERNEYSFSSGYMKEEILHVLKKHHLNQQQIKRMHAVILNVLHHRIRREFKYYCRFARKISSTELIEKIQELTLSEDEDTALRATWMLSIVMGKS